MLNPTYRGITIDMNVASDQLNKKLLTDEINITE
jgi:hypothetical protein